MEEELKKWNCLGIILADINENSQNLKAIIELKEQKNIDLQKLIAERASIENLIYSVKELKQKQVLMLHFLDNLSFEKIAEKLNLSVRHVHRLKDEGLEKCRKQDACKNCY